MGQSVSRWPLTGGPEFYHRAVHVGLMVGKRVLWKVYLPVLLLPPVSIIPPLLHSYLRLHVALTRRTNGRSLGTFQKALL